MPTCASRTRGSPARTCSCASIRADGWRSTTSLNGTYVNGYRMPVIDIHDGQSINVGNPQGPRLTFEIGSQQADRPANPDAIGAGLRAAHPGLVGEPRAGRAPQRPGPPRQTREQTPRPARGRTGPAPAPPKPPGPPGSPRQPRPYQHKVTPPPAPPRPASPREELTVVNTGSPPNTKPPAEFTVIDAKPGDVSNLATRICEISLAALGGRPGTRGTSAGGRHRHARSRRGQRHRRRRRAGLAPARDAVADAAGHRDPRPQRQRDVRQRHPGRARRSCPRATWSLSATSTWSSRNSTLLPRKEAETRTGGLEVRGVKYTVDNGKQLLRRHLADSQARHADRHHRGVRRRQDHAGPADRRLRPAQFRLGHVRGPRHARRIRVPAQPDRHGPAGRRGTPPADGEPGVGLRRRTAAATRHQQSRPRPGRQPRCSKSST